MKRFCACLLLALLLGAPLGAQGFLKGKIRNFGYDFLAAVSWGHFGVFGKFQPASARRFPDPGPTMSIWTVGVCLTTF